MIKDTSLFSALDRTRKGETRIEGFPPIIGSKSLANLLMEINPNYLEQIMPFEVAQFNGTTGKWYNAHTITIICDLYMEAEKQDLISTNQKHVLEKAKILLRALAKVGITALIDEATNYQEVRGKDELQILLEQFIAEELRPYSREFRSEYFEQIFRLYNLPYDPTTSKRPLYFQSSLGSMCTTCFLQMFGMKLINKTLYYKQINTTVSENITSIDIYLKKKVFDF